MLNEKQIQENWDNLIQLIEDTFEGDRKDRLLQMYEQLKDRMMFAPASGTEHFHSCYPGGYVQHVLNIVNLVKDIKDMWYNNGAYMDDYTEEELVFAALHHDLGKVGDLSNDNYIANDSEWHRKNQGKIYVTNPELQYMTAPDRGIWILNQFGIKISLNEMLGIKLADGMYDDGNIKYFKTYSKDTTLKSNLPYIIHHADMTTTRIEYEQWLYSDKDISLNNISKTKEQVKQEQKQVDNLKEKFDELFA